MITEDRSGRMVHLRVEMKRALADFESELPENCAPWSLSPRRPDPRLFPVPELVLFALRDVLGFQSSGVGEKVRWSIYATVCGEPLIFEDGKFGFAIAHRQGVSPELLKRVEGQLSSSLRRLNRFLSDFAKEQIAAGNLTLANRMSEFDNRYRFFREIANDEFAPGTTSEDDEQDTGATEVSKVFSDLTARLNRYLHRQETGYFASGAMVDAYFSRLEHQVLLLRAFVGRPLASGEFEAFLKMTWDERLRSVVNFGVDEEMGRLLGQLRNVKSTIRNPLAHGGMENDGGAFYFHLPRIGAIPANLSLYRGRLQTSFFPISDVTHAQTCDLFDALDAALAEGTLELPNEFVRCGIDPQFDADTIAVYRQALEAGPDAVEVLITRLRHERDRHANMDY